MEVSERIQHIVSYLNTMLVGVSNDSDGSAELSKASMPLLDKYCMLLININVLKRIYNYIENLSEGLKEFYFKMASDISKIPEKISAIENYYSNAKGIARIYVCSSKKCLQRFSSQCKNTIGTYDLPKEFTRSIFNKAKSWAIKKQDGSLADEYGIDESADQAAKTAGVNAFFGNVFEDIIMGFWRERVEKDCKARFLIWISFPQSIKRLSLKPIVFRKRRKTNILKRLSAMLKTLPLRLSMLHAAFKEGKSALRQSIPMLWIICVRKIGISLKTNALILTTPKNQAMFQSIKFFSLMRFTISRQRTWPKWWRLAK